MKVQRSRRASKPRPAVGVVVRRVHAPRRRCASNSKTSTPTSSSSSPTVTTAPVEPPNIVFILTDDLSWNLINEQFAPHIMQLERQGETFDHYFVADSLCCPSRSTIFTGLFPHDTKVVTNLPPVGGYQKFQSEGLDKRTFAVALQHGRLHDLDARQVPERLRRPADDQRRRRPSRPAGRTGTSATAPATPSSTTSSTTTARSTSTAGRTSTASTCSTPTPSRSSRRTRRSRS